MNYITSKVRVGGQLYHLTMDDSMLRLSLAAGGVEPYEYPYDVIKSTNAFSNGYYEPCIEITVCYNLNESASMTMVFDLDEERDNVLRQLMSFTGNNGGNGGSMAYQQAPASAVASGYGQSQSGYGQDMYGQNAGYNAGGQGTSGASGGYGDSSQYGGGYGGDAGYRDNYDQNNPQYSQNNQSYNEYSDENTDVYGANRSSQGGYDNYDRFGGYGSDESYGANDGFGNNYRDNYSQNNSVDYSGNYPGNNSNNYGDNYSNSYSDNYSENYSDNYSDNYSENYPNNNTNNYRDGYSDNYSDYNQYAGSGEDYERGYDSGYGSLYDTGYQSFGEYKYSQGSLSIPEKIIGFIRYPSETFESSNSDNIVSVLIYGVLMLVLFSVVNVVIAALIGSSVAPKNAIFGVLLSNGGELVRLILEYLIFSIICLLVYGILVFLITKITGQGLSPQESLTTTIYSSTALGTIGLIPLIGIFIAPLFMVFLQIKGLMAGYISDTKFAVIAAVLPAIVMFAVFYYVVISGEVAFI